MSETKEGLVGTIATSHNVGSAVGEEVGEAVGEIVLGESVVGDTVGEAVVGGVVAYNAWLNAATV